MAFHGVVEMKTFEIFFLTLYYIYITIYKAEYYSSYYSSLINY